MQDSFCEKYEHYLPPLEECVRVEEALFCKKEQFLMQERMNQGVPDWVAKGVTLGI